MAGPWEDFAAPAAEGPWSDYAAPAQPKFGLGDTWPARLAKDIYSAVTLPGDVYQGKAAVPQSDNAGENIDRVTNLAGVATPLAPGSLGAKLATPAPLSTAPELKQAGVDVFNAVKDVPVPPAQLTNLSAKIENDLVANKNFRETPVSAEATLKEVRNLAPPGAKQLPYWERVQAEMNGEQLPTPPIKSATVGDVRSARMALGRYAGETDLKGVPTPNAAAAKIAMGHIDDFLEGLAPELKAANANYAAGSNLDTLAYRSMQAEHRAAKTGSGSNIENTMRQEVDKIPNRGLSDYERALKNQIVEGDATRNMLRKVGKLGFGDGLSLLAHAAMAVPTGGAWLPFAAGATAARKVGEGLTRNDIAELAASIARRSPLYQSAPTFNFGLPAPFLRGTASGQLTLPQILGLGALPVRADYQ